eukprot:scaffold221859_cov29-Tisochrysis_lutea.AAC.2
MGLRCRKCEEDSVRDTQKLIVREKAVLIFKMSMDGRSPAGQARGQDGQGCVRACASRGPRCSASAPRQEGTRKILNDPVCGRCHHRRTRGWTRQAPRQALSLTQMRWRGGPSKGVRSQR